MATAAQIAASQANAAHSTGPRSAQGKAASSLNALRHGFRSQSVLIPGDDPAQYQTLCNQLQKHFAPDPGDITAVRYVREMADAEWRLRRARTHHEHMLTAQIEQLAAAEPTLDPIQLQIRAHETLAAASPYFRQILRYEEKFERQYERAFRGWTAYVKGSERAYYRNLDRAVKDALDAPLPLSRPIAPRQNEPNAGSPAPENRATSQNSTTEPNPAQTPRNASCPCGSRIKFKRCCGAAAPPVPGRAA